MALTDLPVKIQDGVNIDTQATKARAAVKNVNDIIQLNDNANATKFRHGDVIKIEGEIKGTAGTTEQVRTIRSNSGSINLLR